MPASGAPLGTPAGVGATTSAPTPPNEQSSLVRYIHAGERDVKWDSVTGNLQTMPPVRQRVLLALLTTRGSAAAVPTFGLAMPRFMGTWFERDVETGVRAALSHLTDSEKVLALRSVQVERRPAGRALVTIEYTDLTTGTQDTATVTL